jgi:hypothetical protein
LAAFFMPATGQVPGCCQPLTFERKLTERALDANGSETMKAAGLEGHLHDKDGEIGKKHGTAPLGIIRKIYGRGFAAGYPDTATLGEVLPQLNETSLGQLRRDHDTGHLAHKIGKATK